MTTFAKQSSTTTKVKITKNKKTILSGRINLQTRLWDISMNHSTIGGKYDLINIEPKDDSMNKNEQTVHSLHNVYQLTNTSLVINYLHAACFYPVKSTWLQAIKKFFFCVMAIFNVRRSTKIPPPLNNNKLWTYEAISDKFKSHKVRGKYGTTPKHVRLF